MNISEIKIGQRYICYYAKNGFIKNDLESCDESSLLEVKDMNKSLILCKVIKPLKGSYDLVGQESWYASLANISYSDRWVWVLLKNQNKNEI